MPEKSIGGSDKDCQVCQRDLTTESHATWCSLHPLYLPPEIKEDALRRQEQEDYTWERRFNAE